MPSLTLRPYQVECLEAIAQARHKGKNRLLVSLPTGTGKTVVFAHLPQVLELGSKKMLVLAHREELLEQERMLPQMIDRLAGCRITPERPYARVFLGIRSWLRARVGFTFFHGLNRKQFPLPQSLLAEAIRREEAAQEQQGPCQVGEKDEQ